MSFSSLTHGYKVFNSDFTCNGFQFKENATFTHEGIVKLCYSGFHFCLKASDCFSYYNFDSRNIVCEVTGEDVSSETTEDSKRVCRILHVGKRLTWYEVLDLVNTGTRNTGLKNSGNCNSGSYNSGDNNSGHYNSGRDNSGNGNSGYYNSGHCNSGHYNSGYYNSGVFNDDEPTIRCFRKDTGIKVSEFYSKYPIQIYPIITEYVDGKLVTYEYKEAWKTAWNKATQEQKDSILNLPGFDATIFEEITGIKV